MAKRLLTMKTYKDIDDLYSQLMNSKLAKVQNSLGCYIQFDNDNKIEIWNKMTGHDVELSKTILENDDLWRYELRKLTNFVFIELKQDILKKYQFEDEHPKIHMNKEITSFDELLNLDFLIAVEHLVAKTDTFDISKLEAIANNY